VTASSPTASRYRARIEELSETEQMVARELHVATLKGVASPVRAGHHNLRAILSVRGFRRLMAVRTLSHLADGWFQAGLAGSVLFNPEKQTSPLGIAIGFAVLLLPYSLVGPYVGVFLDRWSRRTIVVVANLIRALLVVPASLMIFRGSEQVLFLILAFLIIAINRLFLASMSAAVPHVVDDRRLVTGNAFAGTLGSICFALGLGSAVFALSHLVSPTFHGYGLIASLAMVGYGGSALLAQWSFAPEALGPDHPPATGFRTALASSGRGLVAGVRHLTVARGAAYAMLAQSAQRLLFGVLALATLLLYRGPFAGGPGSDVTGSIPGLVLVFTAGGVGVLLASVLTPPVARRIAGWRWVAALLAAEGIAVAVFGAPFHPGLLAIAVLVVSVAGQGVKIVVETDLQHECDDDYRGRVFSLNDTAFNATFVVGMFVAALVLPADGRSLGVLITVAVGFVAVSLWYAVLGGRWAQRVGDDISQPEGVAVAPDLVVPASEVSKI
jgi:hypothetical protein